MERGKGLGMSEYRSSRDFYSFDLSRKASSLKAFLLGKSAITQSAQDHNNAEERLQG